MLAPFAVNIAATPSQIGELLVSTNTGKGFTTIFTVGAVFNFIHPLASVILSKLIVKLPVKVVAVNTVTVAGTLLLMICLIVSVVPLGLVTTNSILYGGVPVDAVNIISPLL